VLFTINYYRNKIKNDELGKSYGETESYIQSSSWDRSLVRLNNTWKHNTEMENKERGYGLA
jgi:hypothetical protein